MEQVLNKHIVLASDGKSSLIRKSDVFTMFVIFIDISWQYISKYIVHIDGAGRLPLALVIIAFLLNANSFKKFSQWSKKAVILWFLWTVYQMLNLYIQDSHYLIWSKPEDVYWNLTGKFFFLFVAISVLQRRFYTSITVILCAFLFNVILYYLDSTWELASGYIRFISFEINANEVALECVVCAAIVPMLLYKNKHTFLFLMIVNALVVNLIIITASRTAFIAVFPSILTLFYITFHHFKKNIFFCFIIVAALFCFTPQIVKGFSKTTISQRFESREDIVKDKLENDNLGKIFGERAYYIENGFSVFQEHPLFGIGYTNYSEIYEYRNHIEYMAELSDGGIVGFSLFAAFFFCFLYPACKMLKKTFLDFNILLLANLILTIFIFNWGLFTTSLFPFYCFAAIIFSLVDHIIKTNPDFAFLLEKKYSFFGFAREKVHEVRSF